MYGISLQDMSETMHDDDPEFTAFYNELVEKMINIYYCDIMDDINA